MNKKSVFIKIYFKLEFKTSEFEFSKENFGSLLIIDDFNDDIIRYKPSEESKSDDEDSIISNQIK
jgi:hypothetical protein